MVYRKIVKQGKGAFTVTLPKSWVLENNLEEGKQVNIVEVENDILISIDSSNKNLKKAKIKLEEHSKESFRSIIGSLYRAGFDEIEVEAISSSHIFSNLEKAVNSIFGLELFFINENKFLIKCIYDNENTDIRMHVKRIIFSLQRMFEIVISNLGANKFTSFEDINHLNNNILKQRDLILRIIKKKKLFDDNYFPYYTITLSLWGITRNLTHLYKMLDNKDFEYVNILVKTKDYFNMTYNNINKLRIKDIDNKYHKYSKILKLISSDMKKTNISTFCYHIMQEIQLADSYIMLLNEDFN